MPIFPITGHRFGWTIPAKSGFFQIQTRETGWLPPVGVKNVEGLAAIGVLLQGTAFWDPDAGAILNSEQGFAFKEVHAELKSKGGDGPFPRTKTGSKRNAASGRKRT